MRTPLYLFILFFIFIPSLSWAFNTVHTADYTYYPSFSSISKVHNTKGTHTDISNEHCTVLDIACIDKAFYVFGRDELFGLFLLKLTSFDHFKGFTVWLGPQENVIKIEGQNLFFLGGRLIAHNDILYCMSDGFQGIKMYSSQLKSLGILDTQASVSDIYFSQTGEVIARNKSTQLKKIDLQTKTVTPYLNTLSWSDRIGFSKAYLFKYNRWAITTGIILRDIKDPQIQKTFLFHNGTEVTSTNIFLMTAYQDRIFVFTSDGKAYCIDEKTLTLSANSATPGHFKTGAFNSCHIHGGDIYFSTRPDFSIESGVLALYNMDTKKWMGIQPKTEMQSLKTSTKSHLVGSSGFCIPLFPNREEVSEHALTAYANCCKDAFRFQKNNIKLPKDPTLEAFTNLIEGTGRLCYECIFDFLDPELVPIIIAGMENKANYLASVEWKLRRDNYYFRLLTRLWLKQTDRAQRLLMGLMLIDDPLALKLYEHSRTYGVKDLGPKLYAATQVDKLKTSLSEIFLF